MAIGVAREKRPDLVTEIFGVARRQRQRDPRLERALRAAPANAAHPLRAGIIDKIGHPGVVRARVVALQSAAKFAGQRVVGALRLKTGGHEERSRRRAIAFDGAARSPFFPHDFDEP